MSQKTLIYIISGCFLLAFIIVFIIRKHTINEKGKTTLIVIQTVCGILSLVFSAINVIQSKSTIINSSESNQTIDEYSEQIVEIPSQMPDTTNLPNTSTYDDYANNQEEAMKGSYYSYDSVSECVKEGHGFVKSTSVLNGFIYWNGKPDWARSYYQNNSDDSIIADESEPLHHVILVFNNDNYYGMSLSLHTENHPEGGLAIEMKYDGNPIDCFLSEGTYLLIFGKWQGDSTYNIASAYVTIDHCGTYYINMIEL